MQTGFETLGRALLACRDNRRPTPVTDPGFTARPDRVGRRSGDDPRARGLRARKVLR